MTKLLIKKQGLTIRIPGLPTFRTPAEIDISKVNIELVVAELKRHGIHNYKIKTEDKKTVEKIKTNENIQIEFVSGNDEILNIVKEQKETINNLKEILLNFINSNPQIDNKTKENQLIKIKEIEEVEEFIPTINLGKSKLKNAPSNSIKIRSDYKSSANNLKNILDKKE